jgi:hypothetical protein
MRRQSALLPLIGVMALFFMSCAGGDRLPRQEQDTPSYGSYPYSSTNVGRQPYGPQERAGNQMQNGLPPYSGCQYAARC